MIVEIKLKELNVAPTTVSTQLIFQRIEVYVNGSSKLFMTLYPDQVGFLEYLNIPFEELRKTRLGLGINSDYTPITNNVSQNTTKTFYIPLNVFKGSQPDLRNIAGGVNFRFVFNSCTVFCSSTTASVQLSDLNIVLRQINLKHVRPAKTLRHKFINYIRNSQQISNMTAGQEYDIKLNSLRGFFSHLVVMVRENPVQTDYTNFNTFIGNIDELTFADASNKRQAIPFQKDFNSYVMSDILNSDFVVSHPTGYNIWVISFNCLPSSAQHGIFYGSYNLSTNEHIYLKTNSSFVTGSYVIDIWGAQMGFFDIEPNGQFTYQT
jgi:hypothetical protein